MGNLPSNSSRPHQKHSPVMSQNIKDVSMIDINEALNDNQGDASSPTDDPSSNSTNITQSMSQMNIDDGSSLAPPLSSRKSTLIFNDDFDELSNSHKHIEHQINSDDGGVITGNDDEDDDQAEEVEVVDNIMVGQSDGSGSSLSATSTTPNIDQEEGNRQSSSYSGNTQAPLENKTQGVSYRNVNQSQSPVTNNSKSQGPQDHRPVMVPVEIVWKQGGSKVYVTGSFTSWRKMIGLVPVNGKPGVYHIKLQLPPGTHRFRFIVDNELRFSDFLPTATDQMGNFVNYLEIVPPVANQEMTNYDIDAQNQNNQQSQFDQQQSSLNNATSPLQPLQSQSPQPLLGRKPSQSKDGKLSARSQLALHIEEDPDDMGNGYTRFREEQQLKQEYEYTQDIPAVFTDPSVMEQYYLTLDQQQNNQQNMSWLTPPQLPPQLENVILNNYNKNAESGSENNSGALPIPNHVVLNHLATSSIKHNTLCVASIVRYKRKYATQILYAPLQ
ncbi:SNF1 protein kinase subunit beta-3 [Kluyveromyces marxianus DMKU3-1042]|uniref:SNF1 protein kinase subunit beta-3 n=1 Tax=Kluyveromyces marxianus (strain DMKU3-1042 / BCC 29191 / NBRC 104275) TaxID=1003335 RepID=W0TAH1_KLUMD|nr:SNF1 protein kinase subunit beta-3 [Kluyveromyces marxianus DMKU3-1042]BAO40642.1 SNF1 protein kinase subunit beta-3 [Kluyveromyces marxianus DMKU3-1042]